MLESFILYSLYFLIVFSSFMVVLSKSPVSSAVFLVSNLFFLAGLYAFLGAHFIAAVQIIVYTGGILVLFLFVIMLLNIKKDQIGFSDIKIYEMIGLSFVSLGLLMMILKILLYKDIAVVKLDENTDNTLNIGLYLFEKFLWPFEIISIVILISIIASVFISNKNRLLK